jgi:hypothetical protein
MQRELICLVQEICLVQVKENEMSCVPFMIRKKDFKSDNQEERS